MSVCSWLVELQIVAWLLPLLMCRIDSRDTKVLIINSAGEFVGRSTTVVVNK